MARPECELLWICACVHACVHACTDEKSMGTFDTANHRRIPLSAINGIVIEDKETMIHKN